MVSSLILFIFSMTLYCFAKEKSVCTIIDFAGHFETRVLAEYFVKTHIHKYCY